MQSAERAVQLVDSHCHLDDAQFDSDRPAVIERARRAGLKYLLAIGTGHGPPDLEAGVRLADSYPFIYASVGVHPNDAAKVDPTTFIKLESLLHQPKVKALGEIGLDYHWGVPKETQRPIFVRQLEIAAEARIPVIIHTRDAWEDTIAILRTHWKPTGLPGVMHCFTGNPEAARECLDLGFHLAFGGVTTFPKAAEIREAARITPGDRLLLETDSPYLAPVPHRGKRNEPSFIMHSAELVASARATTLEELGTQTTANFEQLFRLNPGRSR
ncbi:MAG: TatD family hydrolase [Bryobacteraceae bacterium]